MKINFAVFLLLMGAAGGAVLPNRSAGAAAAPIDLAELEAFLRPWIEEAMAQSSIPGAAVSVIGGGEILWEQGFGWADRENRVPVDPDATVFRVGSVSKSMAATAVLAALEERGLGPETEAAAWLEGLPLRPDFPEPLTFAHLLTHTGGFNEHLFGQHVPLPEQHRSLWEFLSESLPPRFIAPGRLIAYVDFHTCLAGAGAARLAGKSFEELAEEKVFRPLSMSRSTFRQVELPPELEAALAKSYSGPKGEVPLSRDYVLTTPAAGLFTTARDMALYLLALDGESTGVMSPESWRRQKTLQFANHPRLPGRSFGFVHRRVNGHRALYKDGQASGFSARLMLLPDKGVGWFSVHNRSILGRMGAINSAGRFHRKLGEALMDRFFPRQQSRPEPVAPTPPDDFASRRHAYLGTYRNVTASRHTWEKLITMADEIRVEPASGDRLRLAGGLYIETEPGLLQWYEGHPLYVAFELPEDGPATHLFFGTGAYERIPWYSTGRWTPRLLGGAALILLLGGMVGAWQLWRRPQDKWRRSVARNATMQASSQLLFLGLLGASLATTETQTLFWGMPPIMKLALALPLMGLVPLALLAWRSTAGWRRREQPLWLLSWVTLQVLAGTLFVWMLNHWNLLGWRL